MMSTSTRPPQAERTIRRKVTASGVIWLDGQSYYVSRRLSGRTIPVTIEGGKLIVDAMIPLHKEYRLTASSGPEPRARSNWRSTRRAG